MASTPIQIEEMMAIKNKHSLLKCKIAVFILSIYILTVNIKHKSRNALYNIFLDIKQYNYIVNSF